LNKFSIVFLKLCRREKNSFALLYKSEKKVKGILQGGPNEMSPIQGLKMVLVDAIPVILLIGIRFRRGNYQ
jgi:hypothetical protein